MGSKENKDRGQDLFTFLQQPLPLRPPGQTNSEEGIMRDRAFAERAETTERLKALRLAHSAASAEQQPPKRRSKVR